MQSTLAALLVLASSTVAMAADGINRPALAALSASRSGGEGEAPGVKEIEVSLATQSLTAWSDGRFVFDFPVTTGRTGFETLTGLYAILNKIPDEAYSYAWRLRLPFWMGIYQAGPLENGFHALPIDDDGSVLWFEGLGQFGLSFGCIVLAPDDAETLFHWSRVGTSVHIHE